MGSKNLGKLDVYKSIIEESLKNSIVRKANIPSSIFESMEYSLLAGGKRIRPLLVLMFADILAPGSSEREEVLAYACSLEMIHTYSLIHDDLPAMDDDDFRRGKPSNHKIFGEAMAILAGDALLTEAFTACYRLVDKVNAGKIELDFSRALNIIKAWGYMAEKTGARGMVGGQVLDLESDNKNIDKSVLDNLQKLKTGCLIEIAIVGTSILLGSDEETIEILDGFASKFGRLFQIQDDILDVDASLEELGKTPGKDEAQNKSTYVSIIGYEESKAEVKTLEKALLDDISLLAEKNYNTDLLEEFLELCIQRSY